MSERYRTLLSLIEAFLERQIHVDEFIETYRREWQVDTDSEVDGPGLAQQWARVAKAKLRFYRGQFTPREYRGIIQGCYVEIARQQGPQFDFVSRNFVDDIHDLLDEYAGAVHDSDRTATPDYLHTLIGEEYVEYLNHVGTDANKLEARRCATLCNLYRAPGRRGANLIAENPSSSKVAITVYGTNGKSLSVEAVVDPDFHGDIALPLDTIEELGLTERDEWCQLLYSPSPYADGETLSHVVHVLYFAEVRCAECVTVACIVPTEGKASVSSHFPSNGVFTSLAWEDSLNGYRGR